MAERAEQAALGYFAAWVKAMSGGDQWVRFHSRILDGDRGGISCVRIEVDGQILMVTPWSPSLPKRPEQCDLNDGSSATSEGGTASE